MSLSDWGSSLFFSVGKQYFLSWMDMEFCQTLFLFFCILWGDLLVSLFIMSIWYITLIDFQKLNQIWISEKNLLDHDVLLSFYTAKFNLLQSKDFYSCVHVGVACCFSFSSHPSLITISRQSCLMEQGGVCPLLCYGGTCG